MKRFLEKIGMDALNERETGLVMLVLLFFGIILGMFLSPKGYRSYGSNNGSYNGAGSDCGCGCNCGKDCKCDKDCDTNCDCEKERNCCCINDSIASLRSDNN